MSDPAAALNPIVPIGVGFDTARYGHHVTFLDSRLNPVCAPTEFVEAKAGYDNIRSLFDNVHQRFANVHFHIRLDAAGQYAANLEAFLRQLPFAKTISVGEPARNQHYRLALFPKRKADPVESLCAARFALLEQPKATQATPDALVHLREIVARLEGQTRLSTRLANQLHNLLARVFPELGLLIADVQAGWVLHMLQALPTPAELAAAPRVLDGHRLFPGGGADKIQQAAAATIASLRGEHAAALVQLLVGQLRESLANETRLKKRMAKVYDDLPNANHLDSIPGIGVATAAVLTAKIGAIERFPSAAHVVSYFGIFAEEDTSGLDKDGRPRQGRKVHMSRKGNDLARKYLWNAAKTAIQHNPAVKALYKRLRGRGVRGDVALGHAMRKLLHLVFAVWQTGRPFDPQHYPWERSAIEPSAPASAGVADNDKKTAGHNQGKGPDRKVVTAAPSSIDARPAAHKAKEAEANPASVAEPAGSIDYAALREQISMEQVLSHLGCLSHLKGSGPQRRGPCPVHDDGQERRRSFSVHLGKNIFQCFHRPCAAQGNVLDLWAAVHKLDLYPAAIHLAQTFKLSLTHETEKRNP